MSGTVLVTGCSQGGIGDAVAQEFHQKGYRVFATARKLDKIQHLKDLGLDIFQLDVTSSSSIEEAVEHIRNETSGTLDVLVNNSGLGYYRPLLDVDLEEAKKMFDVNLFGVLAVTQKFAPLLISAKGNIINIGSIAGRGPWPFQGMYNASKAALHSMSDALRVELMPFDVKVTTVVAGFYKTKFFENQIKADLPESSLYLPIKSNIDDRMSGKDIEHFSADPSECARTIVNNLQKAKLWYWCGGSVNIIWFNTTWLWHTFLDNYCFKTFGLDVLKKKLKLN
ncbi:hypothetical protein B7463_g4245, partial [Scytalidium lignicola]